MLKLRIVPNFNVNMYGIINQSANLERQPVTENSQKFVQEILEAFAAPPRRGRRVRCLLLVRILEHRLRVLSRGSHDFRHRGLNRPDCAEELSMNTIAEDGYKRTSTSIPRVFPRGGTPLPLCTTLRDIINCRFIAFLSNFLNPILR